MKTVYIDINGDILNDILGLESDNKIDSVLQEIVDNNPNGVIKVKPPEIKEKTKKKEKKSSKKKDDVKLPQIKMVKVRRLK